LCAKLCVKLRDERTTDSVCIYIDIQQHPLPLGLLVGTVVEFHRLNRRVSKNRNVYMIFGPSTDVIIKTSPIPEKIPQEIATVDQQSRSVVLLATLLKPENAIYTTVRVSGCIGAILQVTICYRCSTCDSILGLRGLCPNECPSGIVFSSTHCTHWYDSRGTTM